MRSKLKLSRSLEFISAFFKAQQVINDRGGANLAPPPGPDRVKQTGTDVDHLYLFLFFHHQNLQMLQMLFGILFIIEMK